MKFSYRDLEKEDVQALRTLVEKYPNHFELVVRLYNYLTDSPDLIKVDEVITIRDVCNFVGLEGLCDTIKIITRYFDGLYVFDTVNSGDIRVTESIELSTLFANTNIDNTVSAMERYILWKKLYVALIYTLSEYKVCANDWKAIMDSRIPLTLRILMIHYERIIGKDYDHETVCTAEVISKTYRKALLAAQHTLSVEGEESPNLEICRRIMKITSTMYNKLTGETLEFGDKELPSTKLPARVNSFSMVTGYLPCGKRLNDCLNDGGHHHVYQAEDNTARVVPPHTDKVNMLQGQTVRNILSNSGIESGILDRVEVNRIVIRDARGMVECDEKSAISNTSCGEVVFDVRNECFTSTVLLQYFTEIDGISCSCDDNLTVKYNPEDDVLVIASESANTKQVKLELDFTLKPVSEDDVDDAPEVEDESDEPVETVENEDNSVESDVTTVLSWDGTPYKYVGENLYKYNHLVHQVPERFIEALKSGNLMVSIPDGLVITSSGSKASRKNTIESVTLQATQYEAEGCWFAISASLRLVISYKENFMYLKFVPRRMTSVCCERPQIRILLTDVTDSNKDEQEYKHDIALSERNENSIVNALANIVTDI